MKTALLSILLAALLASASANLTFKDFRAEIRGEEVETLDTVLSKVSQWQRNDNITILSQESHYIPYYATREDENAFAGYDKYETARKIRHTYYTTLIRVWYSTPDNQHIFEYEPLAEFKDVDDIENSAASLQISATTAIISAGVVLLNRRN